MVTVESWTWPYCSPALILTNPKIWSSFLPCFLELKPGKKEEKHIYQTLAEGLLSCKSNDHYDVPILGGLLTCDPPQVQLWCFVERNRVLAQVPLGLLSLATEQGVMRLTDLLAFWASMVARRIEDRRRTRLETRFPKRSHTLLPDESEEKMVFKAYRKNDSVQAIESNLKHFQGASTRATSDEFVVLQYPFIPAAKPFPTTNRDFSGVLQDLQRLNNASLVHGDVRLANMIFAENRSHLIDLDFCGKEDVSHYPAGYNLQLGDTLRHPELGGLSEMSMKMRREHDWYSMSAIMGAFEPTSPDDSKTWKNTRRLVLHGQLTEAIEIISQRVIPLTRAHQDAEPPEDLT